LARGDHLALVLGDASEEGRVSLLACDMYTATNLTPLSVGLATVRASRSSLAITRTGTATAPRLQAEARPPLPVGADARMGHEAPHGNTGTPGSRTASGVWVRDAPHDRHVDAGGPGSGRGGGQTPPPTSVATPSQNATGIGGDKRPSWLPILSLRSNGWLDPCPPGSDSGNTKKSRTEGAVYGREARHGT
jgi:hypothetical protein